MKKLIAWVIAASVTVLVVGCGKESSDAQKAAEKEGPKQSHTPKVEPGTFAAFKVRFCKHLEERWSKDKDLARLKIKEVRFVGANPLKGTVETSFDGMPLQLYAVIQGREGSFLWNVSHRHVFVDLQETHHIDDNQKVRDGKFVPQDRQSKDEKGIREVLAQMRLRKKLLELEEKTASVSAEEIDPSFRIRKLQDLAKRLDDERVDVSYEYTGFETAEEMKEMLAELKTKKRKYVLDQLAENGYSDPYFCKVTNWSPTTVKGYNANKHEWIVDFSYESMMRHMLEYPLLVDFFGHEIDPFPYDNLNAFYRRDPFWLKLPMRLEQAKELGSLWREDQEGFSSDLIIGAWVEEFVPLKIRYQPVKLIVRRKASAEN